MWLVYLEGGGGVLAEPGREPVGLGEAVPLHSQPLYLHRADPRGVPSRLWDCRRLALADGAASWGASSGHCRIWVEEGRTVIEDMDSDNGTWLGRGDAWSAIKRAEIRPGDLLRVGSSVFAVKAEPPR